MLASGMEAATESRAEIKTQVQRHSDQLAAELQRCKGGLEEQLEEQLRQHHADLRQQLQHVPEACLAAIAQQREAWSQQLTGMVSTSVASSCNLPVRAAGCFATDYL